MGPEGNIKLFEAMDLEEKKTAIKIPDNDLKSVQGMNRAQRRQWYRKQKKLEKKSREINNRGIE